jgi:hypothetical protein
MIASKCSRNHFSSEINKIVLSFKLHFLQNSLFAQLYSSTSDCINFGNILCSHFAIAFSALPSHSYYVISITKSPPFHCRFVERTGKDQLERQRHAPAAFYFRENPVSIEQEAEWAPGPVWTLAEISSPPGFDSRTVQPVTSRYTDWATRSTRYLCIIIIIIIYFNIILNYFLFQYV